MSAFVTLEEVLNYSGASYSTEQQERIESLLEPVSNALRYEANRRGKDLDNMIEENQYYEDVVKLVTTDVIVRILRQTSTGEPMSQESQSALGYSWSGTYAIPGGGILASIMRNDLKRLGLLNQKIGGIELYDPRYLDNSAE